MFSENIQKQLQLISGIIVALVAVVGGVAELFGKVKAVGQFPSWAAWIGYVALFLLGLWLLIKWRTRHSRLLRPDALRLERDNIEHLVGRADDIQNLLQQCLTKQIVFLEGESGSGKSALVRSGLLPRLKDDKSILPLLLADLWVDQWDRGPFQALKIAMIKSGAFGPNAAVSPTEDDAKPPSRSLFTLVDIEQHIARLNNEAGCTALIIFDQFDDYQARNRERFLPNKTWIDPETLRRDNPFWETVARLVEKEQLRCLFVTRSDTAAGLSCVQFLGPVQALRLDRVPSQYIAELLTRITQGKPDAPVILDPEAGWNRLKDRIVRDVSLQDVVLPQQLKIMLGGIQNLKWLNVAHYERAGGATGIEALYVEQQISGTARKVGLEASQVRAIPVALIDPSNPTKTRSCSKQDLAAFAAQMCGRAIAPDKFNAALEELERGELLRSASDPESGFTAYRLDHDYLTRGVAAAERRANRWYYLLDDGAKAFQNAGSLATQWKSLLTTGTQCRLAWEWLKGTFHYGQQSTYALLSLARFAPLMLLLVVLGFGSWGIVRWNAEQAASKTAQDIWFQFVFRNGIGDRDLEGAWMLAGAQDTRVREEFVRQLLDSEVHAEHLLMEPDFVVQALAVANPNIRQIVAPIVEAALKDGHYSEIRTTAAVAVSISLGRLDGIKPDAIKEAFNGTIAPDQLRALAQAIVAILPRLKPDEVRAFASPLIGAIKGADSGPLNAVTQAVVAIAPQLRPDEARVLAGPLIEAIRETILPSQLRALSKAFAAIARQLKPDETRALVSPLIEALRRTTDSDQQNALAQAVAAIAPQLNPAEAFRFTGSLVETLKRKRYFGQLDGIAQAFAIIVPQLKQDERGALTAPLIDALKETGDFSNLDILAQTFAAIAPQLKPDEARALTVPLIEALKETKDSRALHVLAQAIAAIAPQLKPDEARALTGPLIEAIKGTKDFGDPYALAAISVIALQLKPEEAHEFIGPLVEAIIAGKDSNQLSDLTRAFAAIAPQLKPDEMRALTGPLFDSIKGGKDSNQLSALAQAITAIAPQLKPDQARALTGPLIEAIKGTVVFYQQPALAQAIAAIVQQLKPEEARALAGPVSEAIRGTRNSDQLSTLAQVTIAIAPQLKPDEARALTGALTEEMDRLLPDDKVIEAFAALAEQLPSPERLKLLASALKYPTVHGAARDEVIKQIKKYPAAKTIKPPGNFWAVVEWLNGQPDIDLTRPPERAKLLTVKRGGT
jgi:hypothetical protein